MTSRLHLRPELRYCAFLDILGFKEILRTAESQPDTLVRERLISALNFISEEVDEPAYSVDLPVYMESREGCIERELGDPRLTYVSDCVIISTEHTRDGLNALYRKVSKIWLDLVWVGFFCRGAISEGLLFHHRDIVFGTGYLSAYNLESKASSPRAILDPSIIESVGGFPHRFPLYPPTADRGDDGFVYLRYFPYNFFPPSASDWTNFLLRVQRQILKGLASSSGSVLEQW